MPGRFPPRIFRRVPFEAELRLRFEDGEEVTARSANVSLGGMFVVVSDPRPVSTTFELSFKLPEQPAPVRGRGRVVWVRTESEGAGQPAGMGVRFLELTPGSRELIFEVVERRARDGGSPYDDGEDTGTIADRRGAGSGDGEETVAAPAAALTSNPPAPETAEPEPTAPPVLVVQPRPQTGGPAATDLEASGARPAAPPPAASPPPAEAAESMLEESRVEPAEASATVGIWDREPRAPVDQEPEPPESPPARPALPPVEMPDPPRVRWMAETGRGAYPVASGGYAARASRRSGVGWLLIALVAIAVIAGGAYWLLRGGNGSVAADDRTPAAGQASGDPTASDEGEPAVDRSGATTTETAAGEADAGEVDATGGDRATDAVAVVPDRAAATPSGAGAPAAAAPEITPASPSAGRVHRITHITWRQEDGATELVIWGDGRFDPGAVRSSVLGGERPRALLRLIGITAPFDGGSVEVGTAQVERVRTGLHLEADPAELHVVVDLASDRVTASEVQEDGERLRLRLEGD